MTPIQPAAPSNPKVSMDMLRQVKLRSATLPATSLSTPRTSSKLPSPSTSPHSSLCRLLNGDPAVGRLKRLKKVGTHSFDSLHRRRLAVFLETSRDRQGS